MRNDDGNHENYTMLGLFCLSALLYKLRNLCEFCVRVKMEMGNEVNTRGQHNERTSELNNRSFIVTTKSQPERVLFGDE